jgi:hypothetical protein
MFNGVRLCVGLKFFLVKANGIAKFDGLNFCSYLFGMN